MSKKLVVPPWLIDNGYEVLVFNENPLNLQERQNNMINMMRTTYIQSYRILGGRLVTIYPLRPLIYTKCILALGLMAYRGI